MINREFNAITGETTETLVSQEMLDAAKAANEARIASMPYREKRLAEYPPAADYLDGIVKGDQDQIDAYIEACLAVKEKYPKLS